MFSRRFVIGTVSAVFATALLSTQPPAQAAPGDTKSFVILHSNDQHGHLLPFSYPDRVSPTDAVAQMPVKKNIGGIARRASLIKDIRKREKNVFVFDAGDCMDGTPFSTEFLARADYDALSASGYDFGVFGNHDFNMTAAQFDELRQTARFPLVLANCVRKTDGSRPLPPYVIKNWNGLRVAVFGLVTSSTQTYKAAQEAYTIQPPIDVARRLVPELRKQADLVIAVTHIGVEEDERLARTVPGIDVIVGAHSHTRLPVGTYVRADNPGAGDAPGTVIVQAHQWVGELGRLDVTVTEGTDGRWRVSRYSEQLLPVTDKLPEDKGVARVVSGYWNRIKDKYATVIGQATDEFTEADGLDYTNYYLVADAVADAVKARGAQFDLENRAGVRAPILKGPITTGDVIAVDPFDNRVVVFTIAGRDLKTLLASRRPSTSSALRYEATPDAGNARSPWTLTNVTLDGKPIEDDTLYTGATTNYFYNASVKPYAKTMTETGLLRRELVQEYIKKRGTISPQADGRNKFGTANPFPAGQ